MKFMDEYRDAALVARLAAEIHRQTTRPWTIMEVCGGQTHAIVKFGLDDMLPRRIRLLHGPGCPVCVTPIEIIDEALELAGRPGVIFTSFGDMLRVPGSHADLLAAKAAGADVRMVYAPLDAVSLAAREPDREVVFFGVGFETTAPATALAVCQAAHAGLTNFSLLAAHVLVPPALEALLAGPDCGIQGFLAAGHVCAVTGYAAYEPLARRHGVPVVVTGFEPLDILEGVLLTVQLLESGRAEVRNQYTRAVRREGNPAAQDLMDRVFEVAPRRWRGLGEIPRSGLALRPEYAAFDAQKKFGLAPAPAPEPADCLAGLVLRGVKSPDECPAFGRRCTPEHPLGAMMVSSEGACAAYHRYRRPEGRAAG